MTRIAYLVSDYFAPSHTFVRREVAALRKIGMQVSPFSIQKSDAKTDEAQSIFGRSLVEYPKALLLALIAHPRRFMRSWWLAIRHRPPGVRALVWSQFHFVEAMVLARLLTDAKCDRVHNHFANSAATVGMIAAGHLGIPWSFTLHGISETDYPAGMLLRDKLERADFVACASYFMQAQAMRAVNFEHWSKMHIVRCGVDLSTITSFGTASEPSQEGENVKIICVGRLSAEKGYFGLLEVLARLAVEGISFAVTIVGDGPSAVAIQSKVTELNLDKNIRFTGALSEADTLAEINRSEILVLPSLMEGLPVVLIEALAMQKAVVASQVAGIPELISEGITGLLFAPSKWIDLERQLRNALSNPPLRLSMGREGARRVADEFGSDKAARILSDLFADLSRFEANGSRVRRQEPD